MTKGAECALISKFFRLHPALIDLSELFTRIYFLKLEKLYLCLIAIVYLSYLFSGHKNGVTFSHMCNVYHVGVM